MALAKRFRIGVYQQNPCDISVYFANPGGSGLSFQVLLNDAIVYESATAAFVTLSFIGGPNILTMVVQDGGAVVDGKFLASEGAWMSLYPPGSDPFAFSGADAGSPGGGNLSPITPGLP